MKIRVVFTQNLVPRALISAVHIIFKRDESVCNPVPDNKTMTRSEKTRGVVSHSSLVENNRG